MPRGLCYDALRTTLVAKCTATREEKEGIMAEECSHECSSCGVSGCGDRTAEAGPSTLAPNKRTNVKHVIGVVSGKGGVGKSLVTSLLASEMNKRGHKVAILDADKEGFLRSHRSLTQTAGRAARNVNGMVIMYADKITESMQLTIDETNRRREKQVRYNMEHEMLPRQAQKSGSGQSTLLANTVQTPVTDGIIYPLPDNRQTLAADVTSAYSTESIDTQIARAREEMELSLIHI